MERPALPAIFRLLILPCRAGHFLTFSRIAYNIFTMERNLFVFPDGLKLVHCRLDGVYSAYLSVMTGAGSGNESALYGYSDWQSVSGYARSSMAVLVENGIFSGDNMGRLMPGQTMTRAEMAVVLARTLTL